MKKTLNSKVLKLFLLLSFLLLSVCLPSSSFAKDEYGVVIDDDSNVCHLTLNENTIHYHDACNSDASFSYDSGTGTWNADDSSQVSFEIDGVSGETVACANVFQDLVNGLPGSGAATCNFSWDKDLGENGEYQCIHESEYVGVVTFNGGITGCSDESDGTYQWYQVCGIKDDVLDQADCYIGYTADSTSYPALNFMGDENTSKFYVCVGSCSGSLTQAQYNTSMEVLNSVKVALKVVEIILSLLLI
jgi:hypothetical protein